MAPPDDDECKPEPSEKDSSNAVEFIRRWGPRTVALFFLLTAAYIAIQLGSTPVPIKPGAGVVDRVFASRAVIAGLRVVIVLAAGYIALSIVVLASNGRWITSFAGVQTAKVERSVTSLSEDRDRLASELEDARNVIEGLEEELGDVLTAFEHTSRTLDDANELADSLQAQAGRRTPIWRRLRRGGS